MSSTDPESAPPRARPRGTLRIGQIAGTDVLITSSWFLIAGLIAILMAPVVDEVRPGLGAGKYVAGVAFAIVLYLSVLLHEAAHVLVARHYGYPVSYITLSFIGGGAAMEGEFRRAREEFWIAVVGPLTSIVVGLLALALGTVTPDGLLALTVKGLWGANLIVGAINLVPGLPLDGGRMLKAVVWGAGGNPHRATIVAGWGGRLTAVAVLFWPLLQQPLLGTRATVVDYALDAVIALFLWTSATAAMASARIRRRLPGLVARTLARRTLTVPEDLSVAEAVRRAQEAEAGSIVTVTSSGVPTGIVSEAAILATPEERRPWMAVSTVAQTLEAGLSLPASIYGEDLIVAISRRPAHEYLLLEEDGSLFGVLATADVDRAFRESRRPSHAH